MLQLKQQFLYSEPCHQRKELIEFGTKTAKSLNILAQTKRFRRFIENIYISHWPQDTNIQIMSV